MSSKESERNPVPDNEEHALSAQVQRIDKQLNQVAAANAMNTAQVLTSLDAFRTGMTARFDQVDEKFTAIDEKFSGIDERFDALETKVDNLDVRMDRIEGALAAILDRLPEK